MTAYESNTGHQTDNSGIINSGWGGVIDGLLKQGYSFLGYKYSIDGVLFRGMSAGLLNAVENNNFGLYKDAKPHAELEQSLGIHFVSHELSDAITTARLWEDVDDAGIIVLSSHLFNQCYDAKQAAMMAFAEPGFVFKYPFFNEPIPLEKIECLFVNIKTYEKLKSRLNKQKFMLLDQLIMMIDNSGFVSARAEVETEIAQKLQQLNYNAASPEPTDFYPKK